MPAYNQLIYLDNSIKYKLPRLATTANKPQNNIL